jgi:hypothetical protein
VPRVYRGFRDEQHRFWAKVDRSAGQDECWPWTGCRDARGYGKTMKGSLYAHRIAWEFQFPDVPIPEGMFVCHDCDNPSCCNPSHLFLGTPGDNSRDMVKKGRHFSPDNPRDPVTGRFIS